MSRTRTKQSTLAALSQIVDQAHHAPSLEECLNIVVAKIRDALKVDVAAVFLRESTGSNVLRSAVGLEDNAPGRVVLAPGEGLVSLVTDEAKPVNLANASKHPRYKPFPESGEQPDNAFLGVPIVHQRKVLGALVVQHQRTRQFYQNDVAFLVTLSAQIAGAIAYAEVINQLAPTHRAPSGKMFLDGVAAAPGVCIGTAWVIVKQTEIEQVPDRKIRAIDVEEKLFRFAVKQVGDEINANSQRLADIFPNQEVLLDTYQLMLVSEEFTGPSIEHIKRGLWAPSALRHTVADLVQKFQAIEDPYLRERANDVRALGQRVLQVLLSHTTQKPKAGETLILVGEALTPLDVLDFPFENIGGLISKRGSTLSHLAIVARSMEIPAVIGLGGMPLDSLYDRTMIVDGFLGRVYVDPSAGLRREYRRLIKREQKLTQQLISVKDLPASTIDGARIELLANAGFPADIERALEYGAEGIGLYRSELLFMPRDRFPTEREQYQLYKDIFKAVAPRPVNLRTLDIGGDKPLPYFPIEEPNPFLGWRGVRISLDHPELFLTQLRAFLRAAHDTGNGRLLIPMVTDAGEFDACLKFVDEVIDQLHEEGLNVTKPDIGVMIEVPALVYQMEYLAKRVDYFSIGTNDLVQYLLAVDRSNEKVTDLYDMFHPGVLHVLDRILKTARRVRKPVSICGEMASEVRAIPLLLGLGVTSFSVNPADLLKVKWALRQLSILQCKSLVKEVLQQSCSNDIQKILDQSLEMNQLSVLLPERKDH
jgi:phosphotransferase system enzyme I (PtsP)